MLKNRKQKIKSIVAVLGSIVLVSSAFLSYFGQSKMAYAVSCEQLGRSSYIVDPSFITNKSEDTKVSPDEPLQLYFSGKIPNKPGGDPDWANCIPTTNYVVRFYSYVYNTLTAIPGAPATVYGGTVAGKLNFAPNSDNTSYDVKGGVQTTLSSLIPTVSQYGPGNSLTYYVYVYAYVCPNDACPTTDFLGFANYGKNYMGIGPAGAAATPTVNGDKIDTASLTINPPVQTSAQNAVANINNDLTDASTGLLSILTSIVSTIISLATTLIYWLFAYVIAPLIEAMLNIHPYQDKFVQVIYPGWLILRNLSNIMFILILLIIGLATLFQVEKYNYKHLLVKVVIAAITLNFSLVIGQSILGIADTVQNQFLPDRISVVRALGHQLMVVPIENIQEYQDSVGGGYANITLPFFLLALALGALLCFLAIVVFLIMRTVGLWVLLMVSPLAYAANVLPETSKYFEEWWQKFLAYAFMVPIFAFFLNVAALFANSHVLGPGTDIFNTGSITSETQPQQVAQIDQANGRGQVLAATTQQSTVSKEISLFVYLTGGHSMTLVFIFAGLSFASASGTIGARAMVDFTKKGMKLPFLAGAGAGVALGKYLPRRGAENIHARYGIQLNPVIWKKQWEEYSHHKQQERLLRGQSQGKVLSNPMDFYETYANGAGFKRLGYVIRHLGTAEKFGKKWTGVNKQFKEAQNVLTNDERDVKEDRLQQLNDEFNSFDGNNLSSATAKLLSDRAADAIANHRDNAREAKNDGDTKLETEETNLANALKEFKLNLDKQRDTAGPNGNVQLNLAKAGLTPGMKAAIEAELVDNDKLKNQIKQSIDELNKDLEADDNARIVLHIDTNATDHEIDERKKEVKEERDHLEHIIHQVRRPEFYYARLARTGAENEEEKKLSGIDDAEELKRLLENATHEKNAAKTGAIIKKLAKDSNFNEVLDGKALDKKTEIEADSEGMRLYFEKIQKETRMSDTHKMQLASEVSYINEDKGWWDLSRVTEVNPVGLEWTEETSHQDQIFGEMSKRNSRKQAADFARLSYVKQKRNPITGGWGGVELTEAGRGILKRASSNSGDAQEFERNLRTNTAAAIMGVDDWENTLRADGTSERMIKTIKKKGGEGGTTHLAGGRKFGGASQID